VSPYNDPQPPDDNLPFYWTNAELPSYTNQNGFNVIFRDSPARALDGSHTTWEAELSIVGYNGANYQAIGTFGYGFQITNNQVLMYPLYQSSPSGFQLKSIP